MKKLIGLIGLLAAAAQATPLNEESRAYYRDEAALMQAQLPLRNASFVEISRFDFKKDALEMDYRVLTVAGLDPALADKIAREKQQIGEAMEYDDRQQYYLNVCTVKAPLQPVKMRQRLLDESGKLIRGWQFSPADCETEAAQATIARGAPIIKPRMVSENVRMDDYREDGEILRMSYTVLNGRFAELPPDALSTMYTAFKNMLMPLVCLPEGGMMGGLRSVEVAINDTEGAALPTVYFAPTDCAK
ncbi:MAG: hypothetical protein Q4G28_09600 [Neisseria sp.]|nr:hypothetical protein [Neisseria sp.]